MKKLGPLLLGAWAILSVGALAQYLYDLPTGPIGELETRLGLQLLILNFPGSLLVSDFVRGGPVVGWYVLTLGGLVQWFFLLPLFRLVAKKNRVVSASGSPRERVVPVVPNESSSRSHVGQFQ